MGVGTREPLTLPRLGPVRPHPPFLSGVEHFQRYKDGQDFGRLLQNYEAWLVNLVNAHCIRHLFVEAPKHRFRDREDARGSLYLAGITELVCARNNIEMQEVEIYELKIFVVDKGNCDKGPIMQAARAMGWRFETDDEADAQWLLAYGREVVRESEI